MNDFYRKRRREMDLQHTLMLQVSNENVKDVTERLVLDSLLAKLKDSYKQVIILRHVNQLTVKEVASVLGWSESKVKTTDFRALVKLRETYSSQRRGSDTYA